MKVIGGHRTLLDFDRNGSLTAAELAMHLRQATTLSRVIVSRLNVNSKNKH
jgi:hypothetical protein